MCVCDKSHAFREHAKHNVTTFQNNNLKTTLTKTGLGIVFFFFDTGLKIEYYNFKAYKVVLKK